ncbi:DUF742 domain-containing protein [Allostreptomyces psammosilenae]|uniref:DUF742 domain-containing protein n=1 Tax=Allostreptomyces psammosilenae TaxID=1892865 RepID=A0A853A1B5_9ACTN|nr:DUF742 domain-containing protein [Allostreptomyces psammosilenae]NYI08356.1 hypothetical protein [Allostreptomyces psammosilenae]
MSTPGEDRAVPPSDGGGTGSGGNGYDGGFGADAGYGDTGYGAAGYGARGPERIGLGPQGYPTGGFDAPGAPAVPGGVPGGGYAGAGPLPYGGAQPADATAEDDDAWFDDEAGPLIRTYAITGGRTAPTRDNSFTLITLIATVEGGSSAGLPPEQASIVEMCRWPRAVAEVAATVNLPVSATKILLSDLLDAGLITARAPVSVARRPDVSLLQAVINGLQRL